MKLFKRRRLEKGYLLLLTAISIFLLAGYFSYAMFTVKSEQKEAIRIITGTLEGELKVDGNLTDQLVVSQGETKEFTVTLKNINDRTARYLLYYIETLPEGLEVGYTSDGSVPPEENGRNIASEVTETYIIKVKNTTGSSQTVQLQLDSGLEHIDLALPENGHLFEEMQNGTGAEFLLAGYTNEENAEFNDTTKDKMFVFHHEAGAQQQGWSKEELTDYRYIGADPNNYVTFNEEEAGWRIIGIFTVENGEGEKEQRIKLIHNAGIGKIAWDTGNVNDWTNASLMKAINPDTEETTYNWTDEGKQMIGDAKWYLGGRIDNQVTTSQYYKDERGTTVYRNRPTYWIGKVGLMYPSDYGYATSDSSCLASKNLYDYDTESCRSNDWIFKSLNPTSNTFQQWTMSPRSGSSLNVFGVNGTGYVNGNLNAFGTAPVGRPVVYLVSDVQYLKGNGSKEEPFVFTK